MIILSHRGYWENSEEKNSLKAFGRSFSCGFGAEFDIRDRDNDIVVSHDLASGNAIRLDILFELYINFHKNLPLAINIKADGLQNELARLLEAYKIENYFVFDMAVPDGLVFVQKDFRTFTRQSEYELVPSYYELAQGVWLDEFNGHWLTDEVIERHLANLKELCIISPELHKRDHKKEWCHYKQLESRIGRNKFMLCTDFPEQAQEFFNDQN